MPIPNILLSLYSLLFFFLWPTVKKRLATTDIMLNPCFLSGYIKLLKAQHALFITEDKWQFFIIQNKYS